MFLRALGAEIANVVLIRPCDVTVVFVAFPWAVATACHRVFLNFTGVFEVLPLTSEDCISLVPFDRFTRIAVSPLLVVFLSTHKRSLLAYRCRPTLAARS